MRDNRNNPLTEQRNCKTLHLDRMSVKEIIEVMNKEDESVITAVREALPALEKAIEAIVEVMQRGGRLFYIGAGSSGRLGILDASECPPTYGVEPELVTGIIAGGPGAIQRAVENAEDDEDAGAAAIAAQVTAKDAVVGLASSGATPYVLGAIRRAREIGAVTAGISCNPETPLSSEAEFGIELLVGPEIVTGSTRLKAGSAQKMALNMISTAAMIRLGKVYGNLMVNMQATNRKLRERLVRIVQDAAGVDGETARKYGDEAGWDARTAILMIKFGIGREQAADALARANQHFGNAVALLERGESQ